MPTGFLVPVDRLDETAHIPGCNTDESSVAVALAGRESYNGTVVVVFVPHCTSTIRTSLVEAFQHCARDLLEVEG